MAAEMRANTESAIQSRAYARTAKPGSILMAPGRPDLPRAAIADARRPGSFVNAPAIAHVDSEALAPVHVRSTSRWRPASAYNKTRLRFQSAMSGESSTERCFRRIALSI